MTDDVYRIEDANNSNPAGVHTDDDGKMVGMNNCSDMYLIVGTKKVLLIDLSNKIAWDDTAADSLRSIVDERAGEKELIITVTHKHGDHLGMFGAFADDARASFWIPEAELKGVEIFPEERTEYFGENASLDLGGGFTVHTMEVPGHTHHSTLFFLAGKDLAFTGDALGSGSGVWLFDYESFLRYRSGIDGLVAYLEDPSNHLNLDKLVLHPGHAWQRGKMKQLTAQYVYDMQVLIERIGLGIAEAEKMQAPLPFLDTNFKYRTATITWNQAAAARYAESVRSE